MALLQFLKSHVFITLLVIAFLVAFGFVINFVINRFGEPYEETCRNLGRKP